MSVALCWDFLGFVLSGLEVVTRTMINDEMMNIPLLFCSYLR